MQGRVCVVTGATGALGRVVSSTLISSGGIVFGIHSGRQEGVSSGTEGWSSLSADLTDENSTQRAFDAVVQRSGPPHIVVHTVGGFSATGQVSETSLEEWEHMMSVNLRSAFLCTREALRRMRGASYGRVVLVGAMTGMSASPGRAAYGIAKAGVHRLAETAARECRGSGITVNVIAPGIIDTPSNRASMPDARYEEWVSPATIADTVLWLCRPENACSGTVIQYPGGT